MRGPFLKVVSIIGRVRNKLRALYYKRIFGKCGKNLWIKGRIEINNANLIFVGDNFRINRNACIFARGKVHIGNNVTMSASSKILSGSYDLDSWRDGNSVDKQHICKDVYVGDETWLCTGSIVLPGVHIRGKGVVVAAGAVVTRDIDDDYVVVAGNPARIIRQL